MAWGSPFHPQPPVRKVETEALAARGRREPLCCRSESFIRLITVSYDYPTDPAFEFAIAIMWERRGAHIPS